MTYAWDSFGSCLETIFFMMCENDTETWEWWEMMLILMMEVKSLELNFLFIYGGKEIFTTLKCLKTSLRNWIFRKILKSIIKLWNHVKAFSEWQKAYWGSALREWEKQFAEWELQKFKIFACVSPLAFCYIFTLLKHMLDIFAAFTQHVSTVCVRMSLTGNVESVSCNQKWTLFLAHNSTSQNFAQS